MTTLQAELLKRLPRSFSDGALSAGEKRSLRQLEKSGYVRRDKTNMLRFVLTDLGSQTAKDLRYGMEPPK